MRKVFLCGQFVLAAKPQPSCFVRCLIHIFMYAFIVTYLSLVLIFADLNSSTKALYSFFFFFGNLYGTTAKLESILCSTLKSSIN